LAEVKKNEVAYFDAHCHLQLDPIYNEPSRVVELARSCGIQNISVCGTAPGVDWERVKELVEAYPDILVPSFGLHPWWIARSTVGEGDGKATFWAEQLEEMLTRFPRAHVGECGLDKAVLRDGVSYEQQEAVLRVHHELAGKLTRSLTLHCVSGCWDRLLSALRQEEKRGDGAVPPCIILHSCNSLPKEMVPAFLRLRSAVYFSLSAGGRGGLSAKAVALAAVVPSDRLLIETDSPDQLIHSLWFLRDGEESGAGAECSSGGRLVLYNEPAALPLLCAQLADALCEDFTVLAARTRHNALRAFQLIG
jgi:TatD DNase family protein